MTGDTMKRKALALFSGGLDSILAVRIILDQGIAVEALNFTSPFHTETGKNAGFKSEAIRAAEELNIPIKVMYMGVEFLEIVRRPRHGYGKGINPCIDCRIYILRKAKEYMKESGADFVVTGEVLGQRPMSQRRDTLRLIDRECGLSGLLLRPLSAKLFEPTMPEVEGWVERERLKAIQGRSRKEQMRLAEELNVKNYPGPAGGCLLTEVSFVSKVKDIFDHCGELDLRDFQLLRLGRHFRINHGCKMIVGRDEPENNLLEKEVRTGDTTVRWLDGAGPLGVLHGCVDDEGLEIAGKILLRYTKAEKGKECTVKAVIDGNERSLRIANTFNERDMEEYRI
jgi:tRNA-specific 2-thiouridylase